MNWSGSAAWKRIGAGWSSWACRGCERCLGPKTVQSPSKQGLPQSVNPFELPRHDACGSIDAARWQTRLVCCQMSTPTVGARCTQPSCPCFHLPCLSPLDRCRWPRTWCRQTRGRRRPSGSGGSAPRRRSCRLSPPDGKHTGNCLRGHLATAPLLGCWPQRSRMLGLRRCACTEGQSLCAIGYAPRCPARYSGACPALLPCFPPLQIFSHGGQGAAKLLL